MQININTIKFYYAISLLVFVSAVCSADSNRPQNETRTICEIQERLTNLGFVPGPVDGQVGEKTRGAVGLFLSKIRICGKSFSGEEVLEFLRSYSHQNDKDTEENVKKYSTGKPRNGRIFFQNGDAVMAPLEIKTAKQGYDYYIKISEIATNNPVKTIYLRNGSSIQTKVPLGNFMVKYATGVQWFGEKCLFGLETLFNKADRDFKFEQIGNQISGYSIELIVQREGNLATKQITPEEW